MVIPGVRAEGAGAKSGIAYEAYVGCISISVCVTASYGVLTITYALSTNVKVTKPVIWGFYT